MKKGLSEVKPSVAAAKCLVVKIGSSSLVDHKTGAIHREWLLSVIQDIAGYWKAGMKVVIVSSGAIALGRGRLKLKNKVLQLEEKQAAAAVGQIKLAQVYQELLEEEGITVAQVLLTLDDSENRKRYLNAKNTLETLLNLGAIPIINENDTVATAEIRYGDNDRLAARVAQMVSADTLVLLSDIDGLYTANPMVHKEAQFIFEVRSLTAELMQMGGAAVSGLGTGGMATKLLAAKIALGSGCHMVIAAGKHLHPLKRIDQVAEKTWFIAEMTPPLARKNWLAQHLQPKGQLIIDAGAESALIKGKSLLAIGVTAIHGEFQKGDAVSVLTQDQKELARGLSNYAAYEAKKIMRRQSIDFEGILGYSGSEEMIHRNDLVLLTKDEEEKNSNGDS